MTLKPDIYIAQCVSCKRYNRKNYLSNKHRCTRQVCCSFLRTAKSRSVYSITFHFTSAVCKYRFVAMKILSTEIHCVSVRKNKRSPLTCHAPISYIASKQQDNARWLKRGLSLSSCNMVLAMLISSQTLASISYWPHQTKY